MTHFALSLQSLRDIEAICTRFENSPPAARDVESWLGDTTGVMRSRLREELTSLKDEIEGTASDHRLVAASGGRYRFLERIGYGGNGAVWRVFDTKSERPLAIKMLHGAMQENAFALARLRREALLTGSLQHPGIPPVYDHDRLEDGTPFFSMKLVEGVTLAERIRQPAVLEDDAEQLLGIFEQVAQVLAYAHASGVIHRDVKPHNIMVGSFGEVQLMDWGMAKRIGDDPATDPQVSKLACDVTNPSEAALAPSSLASAHRPWSTSCFSLTSEGDIMGTPAYMAPEQAKGETNLIDSRSDVFGLGVILFEILTRSRFHERLDSSEILLQAAVADYGEAIRRLDRVVGKDALKDLCRSCLHPQRDKRPQDAGVVAEAVSRYLSGVQEQLRKLEGEHQAALILAESEGKQRRVLAGMAGLVGAVLVLGILGVAWQWKQAVDANQRTHGALALADARFQQSQAVVDKYLSEVADSDSLLAITPGADQVRRRLLEKAREYYEQFLTEAGNDPRLNFEAATAYTRLGQIGQVLSPGREDVVELYERAIHLFEHAERVGGQDPKVIRSVASAYDAIGNVRLSAERFQEAGQSYTRAIELLNQCLSIVKDDKDLLALAKATHNLALSREKDGDIEQASILFDEALTIAAPVVEAHPDDPEVLLALGNMYSNAGVHRGFKLRDWKGSLQLIDRSLKLRQHLVAIRPGDHRNENALAVSYNNIGIAYYQAKEVDESRKALEFAAEIRNRLIRDHPAIPEYARQLGKTYTNLGTFCAKQGLSAEAIANYEQSVKMSLLHGDKHPEVLDHRRTAIDALVSLAATDPRSERAHSAIKQVVDLYRLMLAERPESIAFATNLILFSLITPGNDLQALLELSDRVGLDRKASTERERAVLGLLLSRAGNAAEALEYLESIESEQRDCLAWSALAMVQTQLNTSEAAGASLRKAKSKLKKDFPDYSDLTLIQWVEEMLGEENLLSVSD